MSAKPHGGPALLLAAGIMVDGTTLTGACVRDGGHLEDTKPEGEEVVS